jgi:hypothetical protein
MQPLMLEIAPNATATHRAPSNANRPARNFRH